MVVGLLISGAQHLSELGAEEKDRRRIVHPKDDNDERTGRAIGRTHGSLAKIQSDQKLAEG